MPLRHAASLRCGTPTGITVNGLVGLARRCPRLSELRVHFQATTLVEAATSAATPPPSDEPVNMWEDCALTDLEVGTAPFPLGSGSTVARILLQNFPHILDVKYSYLEWEWETVVEIIRDPGRLGSSVHRSGEVHQSHMHLVVPSNTLPCMQETRLVRTLTRRRSKRRARCYC